MTAMTLEVGVMNLTSIKFIIVVCCFYLLLPSLSFGQDVPVRTSLRKNGAYVQPHRRTAPDSSRLNNYSTKGNTNPYTGKAGGKDPFKPKVTRPSRGIRLK